MNNLKLKHCAALLAIPASLMLASCGGSVSSSPAATRLLSLNTINGKATTPIFSDGLTTPASYDISWMDVNPDGVSNKYYLADRTATNGKPTTFLGRVWVINAFDDTVLYPITGFYGKQSTPAGLSNVSGPNGIVVANSPTGAKELWVGDGDSTVRWVNLNVPAGTVPTIGGAIPTGGSNRADELAYDPDDELIAIGNDADTVPFITFISRTSKAVASSAGNPTGRIFLNGTDVNGAGLKATNGIEQPVYDKPFFYFAIPGTSTNPDGEIIQLDPKAMKITARYPTATPGAPAGDIRTFCTPHGLAVGPQHHLVVGCGDKAKMITKIMDVTPGAKAGAILADITQIGGSDMAWYNPGDNKYYVGGGSFLPAGATAIQPSVGLIDAATNTWQRNIVTGSGKDGKSIAVNPQNNHLYTPVSDVGGGGIEVFIPAS